MSSIEGEGGERKASRQNGLLSACAKLSQQQTKCKLGEPIEYQLSETREKLIEETFRKLRVLGFADPSPLSSRLPGKPWLAARAIASTVVALIRRVRRAPSIQVQVEHCQHILTEHSSRTTANT